MNSKKYPVENYVPINATSKGTLHDTLQKLKFDRIMSDPVYHFENCYITNFDLIHHECRNDKLHHSREYYQTISKRDLESRINDDDLKYHFMSATIKCERHDLGFERVIAKEHFNREKMQQKLEQKCIFLSSMRKRAYFKTKRTTENCNSLKF